MKKLKIAILGLKYWPSKGGTSRVVEDIVVQLKDRFDFTIYCYENPEAAESIPGVEVIQFPELPMKGLGVFFFFQKCTKHIMDRGDFDFVHVHKTDAAYFLPTLSKKYTCIATSHEAPYKRDKWSAIGKRYFKMMEKMFMEANAELTCISQPLCEYYKEKYGRDVLFIPNGVDTEVEPDYVASQEILDAHQVQGNYLFFAARRIMGTKGAHTMLEALNIINYNEAIVIAGDTEQLPAYTKHVQGLAKDRDAHFVGYVNSKEKLLAMVEKAEYFIFPSETEGMSIMLLEVASMGTPVVCSDIPENTAVFNEDEVLYFKNKDANDLAEKILWAKANPEAMEEMAARAKAKVNNVYRREVIAERYADLYRGLVPA